MPAIPPITFVWTDEGVMRPLTTRKADQHFAVGERYTLVEHHDRSAASHNHYFAAVHDGWANLPESMADRFASAEHLRKWCLIATGYRDERTIVAANKAEAKRIAAFIKPMDDYAVVVARESTVIVATAKSQSLRAMGRREFEASKEAVLGKIAELIGANPLGFLAEAA